VTEGQDDQENDIFFFFLVYFLSNVWMPARFEVKCAANPL